MRPLIGIPCHAGLRAKTDRPIYYNNRTYIHAVEHAGGVPILIPVFDDLSGLQALLPRLDGLMLSGGLDVDPRYYQEEPHPTVAETNPKLDELELALAQWALQEDVPTLGICRGMQLLNVAFGGNLFQDLDSQYPGSIKHPNWELPRNTLVHRVRIERGSRIEKILGTREIEVNSLHHQATKEPGTGIKITGYADDGVAELMEIPDHRFMVAAQCHPEELYDDSPIWPRLFRAFIDACSISVVRQMEDVQQSLPMGLAS